jgi:hypothetical protein
LQNLPERGSRTIGCRVSSGANSFRDPRELKVDVRVAIAQLNFAIRFPGWAKIINPQSSTANSRTNVITFSTGLLLQCLFPL